MGSCCDLASHMPEGFWNLDFKATWISKQHGFQSNARSLTKGGIYKKVVHTIRQKDKQVVSDQSSVLFNLTTVLFFDNDENE
jgi:hypothetical protein